MSIRFVDLNADNIGQKMSTCHYRSKHKIEGMTASCCGNQKKVSAFKCETRDIFPLKSEHCDSCTLYKN